jgi:hypothetical protein
MEDGLRSKSAQELAEAKSQFAQFGGAQPQSGEKIENLGA